MTNPFGECEAGFYRVDAFIQRRDVPGKPGATKAEAKQRKPSILCWQYWADCYDTDPDGAAEDAEFLGDALVRRADAYDCLSAGALPSEL